MTIEKLVAELGALEAKATPGEWEIVFRKRHCRIQTTYGGTTQITLLVASDMMEKDARLLVALRNAWPKLRVALQSPSHTWVRVEERLPEPDSEEVLIRLTSGSCGIDDWITYREAPVSFSSKTIVTGEGWRNWDFEEVTHWTPLPPAPDKAMLSAVPPEKGDKSTKG